MDVARSLRPSGDDLWSAAMKTLGDELSSQLHLDQNDKQKTLGELLVATEKAKERLVNKSWSFHRKNGQVVFVRDLLTKATKWIKHFQAVGDIVVQCDPVHAGLPWASVRFLLTVATGDLDTYKNLLDRTIDIAEIICRNALVENFLDENQSRTEEGLRHELVKLYASILTYLAKVHSYYQKDTFRRIVKQGLLASSDLESAFAAINEAQASVDRSIAVCSLQHQLESRCELKQMLKNFDSPINRWDKALHSITDQLEGERRRTILRWISDELYEQYHEQAKSEVMKGTGEWLLHDPKFIHLKNECASSILWLYGIPGSGKSKLVSIVIEDAMEAFRNKKAPCPAYFYCSRNPAEPGRSDPSRIVASIARQLSTPRRGGPLLEPTIEVYKEREEKDFSSGPLRLGESKKLILRLLEQYESATIVIDALDECDNETRRDLLDTLEDFLKESPCLLKIFVSSRTDRDITYKLKNYPNLHLSSDRNTADINLFVRSETTRLILAGHLCRDSDRKAEMRDKIIDKLTSKAEGMFRLASLHLHDLCQQASDDAIQERLERLPKSLEITYLEIFTKIKNMDTNADRQYARNALSWLLCAREQLQSDAFLAIVSVTKSGPRSPISKGQLLQICCNFVILDSTTDTFRFAHLSVREFLEDQKMFKAARVNALAAEACLLILIEVAPETPSHTPLLKYSSFFWAEHAREATQGTSVRLLETLREFLSTEETGSPFYRWHRRVEVLFDYESIVDYPRLDWEVFRRLKAAMSYVPLVLLTVCAYDLCGVLSTEQWRQLAQTRPKNKNGETHQEIALRYGSGEILEWQFSNNLSFEVTDEVINIAASNHENGERVIGLLLDIQQGSDVLLTQRIIQTAALNWTSGERIMALLLGGQGIEIHNTQENAEAIMENFDRPIIEQFFDRIGSEIQVNEGLVKAAARNRRGKAKHLRISMARIRFHATGIAAAAKNDDRGKGIIAFLLEKGVIQMERMEEVVKAIAETCYQAILQQFLDKYGVEVQITEAIVEGAARNWHSSHKMVTLLLEKQGGEIPITEQAIDIALESSSGRKAIALLIEKSAATIPMTERVVLGMARHDGESLLLQLIDKRGSEIAITGGVIEAIAVGVENSKEVTVLLLEKGKVATDAAEGVVKAILEKFDKDILQLFLDQSGVVIQITEEIVYAVEENWNGRNGIMDLLLEKRRKAVPIPEGVIKAIAGNLDATILQLVLDKGGADVQVTGEVLEAAAGNWGSGKEILALLLEKRGGEIPITEEALISTCCRLRDSTEMLALLLENSRTEVLITEEVVKAAAESSTACTELLGLLLERHGSQMQITEGIVKAAAGNDFYGRELMAVLLEKGRPQIPITDKVVKAVVQNEESGKEILMLLLERGISEIPISKEVLEEAREDRNDGKDFIKLFSQFVNTDENTTPLMMEEKGHEELARKQHQTNVLIRLEGFGRHLSLCIILIVLYFIVGSFSV